MYSQSMWSAPTFSRPAYLAYKYINSFHHVRVCKCHNPGAVKSLGSPELGQGKGCLWFAHLVGLSHVADESILCVKGGDAALPKLLWDFLLP